MKLNRFFLILLSMGVLFLNESVYSQQPKFDVYIRVVPQDAEIKIYNSSRSLIAAGQSKLDNEKAHYTNKLPQGRYTIEISKAGYETLKTIITVPEEDNKTDKTYRLKEQKEGTDKTVTPPKEISDKADRKSEKALSNEPSAKAKQKTEADKIERVSPNESPVPKNIYSLNIELPDGGNLIIRNLPPGEYQTEFSKLGEKSIHNSVKIPDTAEISFKERTRTLKCKGHNLKFIRVSPPNSEINIALTEKEAKELYKKARDLQGDPLYPMIFRSISEDKKNKTIPEFWIQAEPISEELYKEIIPGGLADRISFNDAMTIIKTLNEWCNGAKFDLPTEEQFVYLSRTLYDPVQNEGIFKKCSDLKEVGGNSDIKYLLGNKWQLTKSKCEKWSRDESDPNRQCNETTSYIKKGGTTNSKDATECIPEYRAESSPDVREPNTTVRLVLQKTVD